MSWWVKVWTTKWQSVQLLSFSLKVASLPPVLSGWSLYILSVKAWSFFKYSGVLTQIENMHARLTWKCQLSQDMSKSVNGCFSHIYVYIYTDGLNAQFHFFYHICLFFACGSSHYNLNVTVINTLWITQKKVWCHVQHAVFTEVDLDIACLHVQVFIDIDVFVAWDLKMLYLSHSDCHYKKPHMSHKVAK